MSHSWRLCISLITCHTAQMREDAEVMAWLQAAWLGFWTHQAALLAVRWWNGIPKYWSSRSKLAQEEVWFYHSGGKNHEEPIFHIVLRCFGKPGAPTKRGSWFTGFTGFTGFTEGMRQDGQAGEEFEKHWQHGTEVAPLQFAFRGSKFLDQPGITRSGSTRAGWFWWFSRRPSKNQV
jgi:hypothetical protein